MTINKKTPAKKKSTSLEKGPDDAEKKKELSAKSKKAKDASLAPKSRKKISTKKSEDEEVRERPSLAPFVTPPKPVVAAPPVPLAVEKPPVAHAKSEVVAPPAEKPKLVAPPPPPPAPVKPAAVPKVEHVPFKQKTVTPVVTPIFRPPEKKLPPPPPPTKVAKVEVVQKSIPKPVTTEVKSVESSSASTREKIQFNEMMTVQDLANAMGAKTADLIKKLLTLGTPASINQRLSFDVAALAADSFGFDLELKSIYVMEEKEATEDPATLVPRPPVVTVMGHVDHGKTSLLDAIRSTSVVKGEAGGITQHIGAYQVKVDKGTITFLDTPGHEAFTAMRARGAMATDLVILVVAADDSVMPQTVEAINHARAAGVPIVVAINKVDLPQANVQKVKQELAQQNLLAEDWGGKTVMVEVSAKTHHNIDKLLEMILLESELLELKANPQRSAKGIVLEAHMDPRRGIVATVLIQAGTLKVGDVLVCGLSHGRARAMLDEKWAPVELAGPSRPIRILGLSQIPQVGDHISVVSTDREAREIAERRRQVIQDRPGQRAAQISLENLHQDISEGKIENLPVIMKTDVQGSLQAILDSLAKMPAASIQLQVIHSGIGTINESDILLAEASNAIVFGFNVKAENSAELEAKRTGVDIRTYEIIYEMLADIRAAMEGLLKPEEREVVKGRAQIKSVFASSRLGAVAGCLVLEGKIARGNKAKLMRGSEVVATGSISSLRRFKDDVKDVEKGYECGISIEGVKAYNQGDLIEVFVIEKHARRLEA